MTPERERGKALGRLVSGIMLGIMLARPLSSFVAGYGSWRLIYLLCGGATVLLTLLSMKHQSRVMQRRTAVV